MPTQLMLLCLTPFCGLSAVPATLILLGAYVVGCLTPSYYVVRWKTGRDLRASGSGTVGATNAGRMLGKPAYVALALADILKGFLVLHGAAALGLASWWLALAGLLVVLGHVFPLQLGFHGGKGAAVAYGVMIAVSPATAALTWVAFFAVYLSSKKTTMAALAGFWSAPLLLLISWLPASRLLQPVPCGVALLAALAGFITLTHLPKKSSHAH